MNKVKRIILVVLATSALWTVSFEIISILQLSSRVKDVIEERKADLESLLISGDYSKIQKNLWGVASLGISSIDFSTNVYMGDQKISISSGEKSNSFFKLEDSVRIVRNGLELGALSYSTTLLDIFINTIKRQWYTLIILVVSNALIISGVNFFYTWSLRKIQMKLMEKIGLSKGGLENVEKNELSENFASIFITNEFINHLNEVMVRLNELYKTQGDLIIAKKMSDLASQVAHDIRSPLSALNMVAYSLTDLPEEKRIVLRNSIQRINDIANDLLAKGKNISSSKSSMDMTAASTNKIEVKLAPYLLPTLVDSIVSEKRIQFRDKPKIQIEADINTAYGVFAKVQASVLSRVLSNLVNNAVEAFEDSAGKAVIRLRKENNRAILSVEDNGKGIPKSILNKLGEKGATSGKEGSSSGSGLGVFHAKSTVEAFGGEFKIESQEGTGTRVNIALPICETPAWFRSDLEFKNNQRVIVLDDDLSIHGIWSGRFQSLDISSQIEVRSFTSGEDFRNLMREILLDSKENGRISFLIDYELLNQPKTGLDLIEELSLSSHQNFDVCLVTSRFEEEKIQERCQKFGIKLIPKNMAGFISIKMMSKRIRYDACLINDDELVHMTWNYQAKQLQKNIRTFKSGAEFKSAKNEISKETPIYIDSNLGADEKGEILAQELYKEGFEKLHITTGYDRSTFEKPDCVIAVLGKDPAF